MTSNPDLFMLVTHPLWLPSGSTDYRLVSQQPVSRFGCRRYVISATSPQAKARLQQLEVPALSYALPKGVFELPQLETILRAFLVKRTGFEPDAFQTDYRQIAPMWEDEFYYMCPSYAAQLQLDLQSLVGLELAAADFLGAPTISSSEVQPALHAPTGLLLVGSSSEPGLTNLRPLHLQSQSYFEAAQSRGAAMLVEEPHFPLKLELAKEICRLWRLSFRELTIADTRCLEVQPSPEKVQETTLRLWTHGAELQRWLTDFLEDLLLERVPTTRVRLEHTTVPLQAYSETDLKTLVAAFSSGLPLSETPSPVELTAPLLVGHIVYEEGEWFIDLAPHQGRQMLASFETDQPQLYQQRLWQSWVNGHHVTSWGHYLWQSQGRLSVMMVKSWQHYDQPADFEKFIKG